MEKVPIVVAVEAKGNWKKAEVEPKSETGGGNGNKSGDAEVVGVLDDSGKKQSLAEVMGDLDDSGEKQSVAEVVGVLDDSGKKQSLAEIGDVLDDSGKKQSLAEDVGVSKMASGNNSGKIKPDESASVEQSLAEVVGESKTVSETEKMLESMKELNKKLMEMTYKGKLTCEYDKKDMKSKNKSNDDDDDDEEPVKGCMSWLL